MNPNNQPQTESQIFYVDQVEEYKDIQRQKNQRQQIQDSPLNLHQTQRVISEVQEFNQYIPVEERKDQNQQQNQQIISRLIPSNISSRKGRSKIFENIQVGDRLLSQQSNNRLSVVWGEKLICNDCGLGFDQLQFLQHQDICEERPIPCQYCGDNYPKSLVSEHEDLCPGKSFMAEMINNIQNDQVEPHQDQIQRSQIEQDDDIEFQSQIQPQIQSQNESFIQQPVPEQLEQPVHRYEQLRDAQQQSLRDQMLGTMEFITQAIQQFRSSHSAGRVLVPNLGAARQNLFQRARQPQQLGARIPGQVNSTRIPTYVFKNNRNLSASAKFCTICRSDYEEGDQIKLLGCSHRFHTACVDQWLTQKSRCPLCKRNPFEGLVE